MIKYLDHTIDGVDDSPYSWTGTKLDDLHVEVSIVDKRTVSKPVEPNRNRVCIEASK